MVPHHAGRGTRGLQALASALTIACSSPRALPPELPGKEPIVDADAKLEAQTRDVVVAHAAKLRSCYERALARTPELEGKVVLVIEVGQSGRAEHVLEGRREGLGDDVVRCLARELKTLAFHDGAARKIRIQVPFAFSRRD